MAKLRAIYVENFQFSGKTFFSIDTFRILGQCKGFSRRFEVSGGDLLKTENIDFVSSD